MRVKWKLLGKGFGEINSVTLHISPFKGSGWANMLQRSISLEDEEWGDFSWTIPDSVMIAGKAYSLANRAEVHVKVMQYSTADTNKIAITRNPFSIAGDSNAP